MIIFFAIFFKTTFKFENISLYVKLSDKMLHNTYCNSFIQKMSRKKAHFLLHWPLNQ